MIPVTGVNLAGLCFNTKPRVRIAADAAGGPEPPGSVRAVQMFE